MLERGGRTFLLCAQACPVRDAVLPGGEIADGYRLKRLGEAAVIASGNGPDIELSLSSPAH